MEKSSVEITGAIDKSVNSDDSIENYLTGMRSRYSKMETKLLYTLDIRSPRCVSHVGDGLSE